MELMCESTSVFRTKVPAVFELAKVGISTLLDFLILRVRTPSVACVLHASYVLHRSSRPSRIACARCRNA